MKKLFLPLIALLLSVNVAFAQDNEIQSPWVHGGTVGLNIAQSHFDNWSAGGQDNINMLGLVKYDINYQKGNNKWDNNIDLQLGYSYYNLDKKPIKTDDRIYLSSLYGHNLSHEKWFATANLTFQSQFADGYNYAVDSTNRISGFMNPGYVTLGLGVQWVPSEHFKINLSPLTGKMIIVADQKLADAGAYGVKKAEYEDVTEIIGTDTITYQRKTKDGEKIRWELGAQLIAEFNYEIFKNVTFSSKLIAFYDYLHKSSDLNALGEKYTCPVDFDWDNQLIMKVNDWLSCNISARLVYDEDVAPLSSYPGTTFRQFKEVMSIGISYKIP
ncbi:MAG: DUF3078 domain-containing protein [Bacteroidales bacterium]|nr:DUF3078 domain-containing protein [Bacteroidales bacterium]